MAPCYAFHDAVWILLTISRFFQESPLCLPPISFLLRVSLFSTLVGYHEVICIGQDHKIAICTMIHSKGLDTYSEKLDGKETFTMTILENKL